MDGGHDVKLFLAAPTCCVCVQVRDLLTSTSEQASKSSNPTLKADAVAVDGVVSTIGFPLVGGPAGTMEGGRQADVAKSILTAKNIPYMVAAPLLIQVTFLPVRPTVTQQKAKESSNAQDRLCVSLLGFLGPCPLECNRTKPEQHPVLFLLASRVQGPQPCWMVYATSALHVLHLPARQVSRLGQGLRQAGMAVWQTMYPQFCNYLLRAVLQIGCRKDCQLKVFGSPSNQHCRLLSKDTVL